MSAAVHTFLQLSIFILALLRRGAHLVLCNGSGCVSEGNPAKALCLHICQAKKKIKIKHVNGLHKCDDR